MKKFVSFVLICICLSIFSFSSVYAVGIDMDLVDNTSQRINNSSSTNNLGNNTNSIRTTVDDDIDTQTPAKVSTTRTSEEFHLTVSNIIDIILIAVGIVIIFLAIAIFLKIR